ncbi:Gfo/Idh/MocA family protein [Curtobacterium ammoniigenes]|uniref:Gfo/Idh/MocA family protein n=1 Tax=Curtobacterium ammoniigenes TaxID=395387 RepID=UPI0009F8A16E|nr:Gfo/Idh/MocA family oxidoreductase [Curtobacterium ammoniigenes]
MRSLPAPDVIALHGAPALRWGVIGPGVIANDFTATLHANSDQRVVAVGSRSLDRAEAFAARHGAATAYGSYEALVADPGVDIVYIASPHPQHFEHAMLAIAAGKHVLVEKPMTTSPADTRTLVAAARAAGVFAAEALWTRFLPQSIVVAQLLADGALGTPRLALVDVGWPRPIRDDDRMFHPGGGGLLDAGVYGLWFAQFTLGRATDVRATGILTRDDPAALDALGPDTIAEGDVDLQSIATLRVGTGPDAPMASVTTTLLAPTDGRATLAGSAGVLRFTDHFVFPAGFVVRTADGVLEFTDPSGLHGRDGLVWQAAAAAHAIGAGRTEFAEHSLDDSIALADTLDSVRKAISTRA